MKTIPNPSLIKSSLKAANNNDNFITVVIIN